MGRYKWAFLLLFPLQESEQTHGGLKEPPLTDLPLSQELGLILRMKSTGPTKMVPLPFADLQVFPKPLGGSRSTGSPMGKLSFLEMPCSLLEPTGKAAAGITICQAPHLCRLCSAPCLSLEND